jgi:hypothetical protein
MKKSILTILIFSCIGISASMSQSKRGTFILGFGYSFLGDYASAPYSKSMMDYGLGLNNNSSGIILKKDYSVSIASYYFQMNTLLKEFNANTSLSLNISPGIRLSGGNYGFGSASFPITLNFNKGMLSSMNSDANTGVTFGLGVNILTSTLVRFNEADTFSPFVYAQPCAQLGFRFWTRSQTPYEVMLQAGYLPLKNADVQTTNTYYNNYYPYQNTTSIQHNSMPNSSASFRISMVKYLNY